MQTAATDMLEIEFPIFAFSHCRDVVAAVTKAGGLGVLGAVAHSPEALETDLAWIENEVGSRPYGVDLIVPAKYAGDEDGGYTLDDIAQLIPDTHTGHSSTKFSSVTTYRNSPPMTPRPNPIPPSEATTATLPSVPMPLCPSSKSLSQATLPSSPMR